MGQGDGEGGFADAAGAGDGDADRFRVGGVSSEAGDEVGEEIVAADEAVAGEVRNVDEEVGFFLLGDVLVDDGDSATADSEAGDMIEIADVDVVAGFTRRRVGIGLAGAEGQVEGGELLVGGIGGLGGGEKVLGALIVVGPADEVFDACLKAGRGNDSIEVEVEVDAQHGLEPGLVEGIEQRVAQLFEAVASEFQDFLRIGLLEICRIIGH